jgi:hypothetical protein
MKPFIQINRHPYEEPYHLNVVMTASNGKLQGALEFYINAESLLEWAKGMEEFPSHAKSMLRWEIGSENPDDRFSFYFRMRLFTTDSVGHCALQLRFNNNRALPEREISEFCLQAEPSQINSLGRLIREFGQLRHRALLWEVSDGALYETIEEAEQALGGDAWKPTRASS